ncbi:hypothetical protein VTJ04DRAFT_9089 [Mycothermus thermophilus]|uniref:uncharacterized protein n=1 Tax=Humicola insolens TaxID=85995 RepID=UPI00374399D2
MAPHLGVCDGLLALLIGSRGLKLDSPANWASVIVFLAFLMAKSPTRCFLEPVELIHGSQLGDLAEPREPVD